MAWTFRTYVSPSGRHEVQSKIDEIDPVRDVIIEFAASVRFLANTPRIEWKMPDVRKLQGVDDIYEIRFKAEKREWRPLGFFGPGPNEFTILIWSSHKQNIYDPADAINTAQKRKKKLVVSQEAGCAPLQIDGEEFPPPQ